MKRSTFLPVIAVLLLATSVACAQGNKAPASPPATATAKLSGGATITINYSQPSVKGRTIGENLEPLPGKVWRTGANKATVFETDKAIKVEEQDLPAGKYGLFTIADGDNWTIIFNKTWDQWGAFKYDAKQDALRVNVKSGKAPAFAEKFTIQIDKSGKVTLLWGATATSFSVQ